jgi:hypothetical protein
MIKQIVSILFLLLILYYGLIQGYAKIFVTLRTSFLVPFHHLPGQFSYLQSMFTGYHDDPVTIGNDQVSRVDQDTSTVDGKIE